MFVAVFFFYFVVMLFYFAFCIDVGFYLHLFALFVDLGFCIQRSVPVRHIFRTRIQTWSLLQIDTILFIPGIELHWRLWLQKTGSPCFWLDILFRRDKCMYCGIVESRLISYTQCIHPKTIDSYQSSSVFYSIFSDYPPYHVSIFPVTFYKTTTWTTGHYDATDSVTAHQP